MLAERRGEVKCWWVFNRVLSFGKSCILWHIAWHHVRSIATSNCRESIPGFCTDLDVQQVVCHGIHEWCHGEVVCWQEYRCGLERHEFHRELLSSLVPSVQVLVVQITLCTLYMGKEFGGSEFIEWWWGGNLSDRGCISHWGMVTIWCRHISC